MPIRVLHITLDLGPGGIERWLLSMLRAADRNRVAMDFCCRGPEVGLDAGYAQTLGAQVFHCPLRPSQIGFLRGLERILKSGNYSILHNHMELYSGLGVLVAKRCGIPVITSFHNTSFPASRLPNSFLLHKLREIYGYLSIKYAVGKSDLITGCSQTVLDSIRTKYNLSPKLEKVLHYGVELTPVVDPEQRQAFRDELGINQERILITHIGNFKTQKNHQGLVRVAEKVIAEDARAQFLLVGGYGDLRPKIEEMVQTRNLTGNFTFLGIRNDVERILGCSDIFFFPSLWEGLGLVVLEAMAAGLPVVASDLPVLRETIVDGRTGLLWPSQDEPGLARHLIDLLANPQMRNAMGNAGRRRVAAEFSLKSSAEKLWKTYEDISHS